MALGPDDVSEEKRVRALADRVEQHIDEELSEYVIASGEDEESWYRNEKPDGVRIHVDTSDFVMNPKAAEILIARYKHAGWTDVIYHEADLQEDEEYFIFLSSKIKPESGNKEPNGGFVYIFQCNGLYKIGRSQNPHERMKKMAGAIMPFEIKLVHTIPSQDPVATEAMLHKKFAERRVIGEWFKLEEEEILYLLGLISL